MHASHPAEVQAASELLLMSQDLLPQEEEIFNPNPNPNPNPDPNPNPNPNQEDEIFTFPLTGEIAPYASTTIPLTYRPRNPGNSLGLIQLTFGAEGTDAPAMEVRTQAEPEPKPSP